MTERLVRCALCGTRVRGANLARHLERVHPGDARAAEIPLPKRARQRPSLSTRGAAFLVLVLLIGAASGYLLWRSAERVVPIDTTATPLRISMGGFAPDALGAQAGVPLRINLINLDNPYHSDGGGWHDFVLPELGVNVSVEPEGQTIFTLEVPTPGAYTWYCDLCCGGKANPAMRGTLTVNP